MTAMTDMPNLAGKRPPIRARHRIRSLERQFTRQNGASKRLIRRDFAVIHLFFKELHWSDPVPAPGFGVYRPSKAIEMTNGRRQRSRRNRQFCRAEMAKVDALLEQEWSPEQISVTLKQHGELSISHETIYQYVWDDKRSGGTLHQHLRQAPKKRRKRHNTYDSRGRLAGKRMIDERPAAVDSRRTAGHWEIDTVMGGRDKHCIVTIVERKAGYVLIGKLKSRTTQETNRRILHLIRKSQLPFKTITADNGTEFHAYPDVERITGVKFYFAHPYHSWERGTNENTNGLIRQYLPKRKSMANITQYDCNAIAKKLNTRPRKRLGFKTPEKTIYGI